jgi:DNA-binding transcriptional MerR regulator
MQTAMKVGAWARCTGLTVRSLHHYDEIGLLSPPSRTESGHRLYGEEELNRLQQIASLRHLGLPLEKIRECLARSEYSLEHVFNLQIDRIDEQIRRQKHLWATPSTTRLSSWLS